MSPPSSPTPRAPAVDHYENFPVASWLCPAALRPAVAAIYWFARTADDIADEGDGTAAERLADLAAYRTDLAAALDQRPDAGRWPQVFAPLRAAIARYALPAQPLADLLDAFAQDVRKTAEGSGYADRAALLGYCARSANPVGRLMLHLYGVTDAQALARSDAICSALQLINFWQDLSVDLTRGRYYLPQDRCSHHGVACHAPGDAPAHAARALVAEQVHWTRALMASGAPLVRQIPGRAGWELRLVVQGGLRILDRIEAMDCATWRTRPRLQASDGWRMLWRALRM